MNENFLSPLKTNMKKPSHKHLCCDSSEKEKNRKVEGNLRVKGNLDVEKNLKVEGDAKFKENVDIKRNLNVGGNEVVKGNLNVVGTITSNKVKTNEVDTNVLCLSDQTSPPPVMPNAGCLYTLAGTPDSLQFIDNSGSTYTVDLTANNPFNGWWQITTAGCQFGFGNNAEPPPAAVFTATIPLADQYIFIDTTTKPYATTTTTYGTLKYPRQNQPDTDISPVTNQNLYFFQAPDELVSIFDLNGPSPSIFADGAPYSAWTLKLQADGNTIAATPGSQAYYTGYSDQITLYKRIKAPPPIMPNDDTSLAPPFPDYNNPLDLAKYYVSVLKTSLDQNQNVNMGDQDYVGFFQANALFDQFLTGSPVPFTRTTPIRQIRVSASYQSRKLTDIYTGDPTTNTGQYSYATGGSTVVLAGFTGPLAVLNGTYVDGVAFIQNGPIPNPRSNFIDSGPNGSFNDQYNRFLLNYDSSALIGLANPATNFITVPPGATVTVTHRFLANMEYPAFCAALSAMFYAVYQNSSHHAMAMYSLLADYFLFAAPSWNVLQSALASNAVGLVLDFGYINQSNPSLYYLNNSEGIFFPVFPNYNDPYNLIGVFTASPYNTVLGNYLINPQNLYWAIQGTLDPDQPDPSIWGYPPLIPGPGRASFVGTLSPPTVVNGVPTAVSPGPNWTPWGGTTSLANNFLIAQINPAFTAGKVVGYWSLADCIGDQLYLMNTGLYSPDSPANPTPRSGREAYNSVLSVVMAYFATTLNCDTIILDIRGNRGGAFEVPLAIAEFMGTQRAAQYYYQVKPDDGFSALIDPATFPTVNNYVQQNETLSQYCYVNLSAAKYPNSMFVGTSGQHKKLIILADEFAASAGSTFTQSFAGENQDKNIGGFVDVFFYGTVDSRCKGSAPGYSLAPYAPADPYLSVYGEIPIGAFEFEEDYPNVLWKWGLTNDTTLQQTPSSAVDPAPSMTGTAGNNPLPMSWETTVYLDFGFITPNPYPYLPGWTKGSPVGQPSSTDQTTWRDSQLEQCILTGSSIVMPKAVKKAIKPIPNPANSKVKRAPDQRPLMNKKSLSHFHDVRVDRRTQMAKLRALYKEKAEKGEVTFNKMGHPIPTNKFKPFSISDLLK